jgi:hypothetical protein
LATLQHSWEQSEQGLLAIKDEVGVLIGFQEDWVSTGN